jgi:putative SOS response-associated peptidase YedK
MCGRYTLAATPQEIMDEFGLIEPPFSDHAPRYNIAPTQAVLAVVSSRDGLKAGLLRWGLIPSWAKDASAGNRMINARAETLPEKPSFRDLVGRRPCLIIADGFYEWKRDGKRKTPMHIRLRSGRPFAMAGLWDRWIPPEGGPPVHSCTILTTEPNDLIRPIHDRMPVILPPSVRELWLGKGALPDLESLLVPYAADDLEAYSVSPAVNSVANDGPELIEGVAETPAAD